LFVAVDLRVDDTAAVIERRVQEHIAHTGMTPSWVVAFAMYPPAAPVGNGSEFLDIDMDQFTWVFPLIAAHRLGGGVSNSLCVSFSMD
jgi:hypothetical protein